MRWWWLSFVDESRPEGDQFLGACVVQADSEHEAIDEARAQGCHPGGNHVATADMSIFGDAIYTDPESPLNEYGANRLLSVEELYAHGERKAKDLPDNLNEGLERAEDAGALTYHDPTVNLKESQ